MMQKLLFIGAGGTGGKTIRYIWRELDRRLKAAGWDEGMPAGWQFVHIDVPQNVDVIEEDVPADIGSDARYVGLARFPREYKYYDSQLVDVASRREVIAGWRPNPVGDFLPPFRGAGQRRAVGRVVALSQLASMRQTITESVARTSTQAVDDQLQRLSATLGFDGVVPAATGSAYVISSLGGGSGSGIFLDLVELVRGIAQEGNGQAWLSDVASILFTADVFSAGGRSHGDNIAGNTLGAVSEMLASFHDPNDGRAPMPILELGGAWVAGQRRSSNVNFFVGIGNGNGLSFSSNLDSYRSVAKALAALHLIPSLFNDYTAYIGANAVGGAPVHDDVFPFVDPGVANGASSLGYSNVTLGRELFGDYVAQRLAKRSVNRLLYGHRAAFTDPSRRQDHDMAAIVAEDNLPAFLEQLGVRPEAGEVRDALLGPLRQLSRLKELLDGAFAKVRDRASSGDLQMPAAEWRQRLEPGYQAAQSAFAQQAKSEAVRAVADWAQALERRLVGAATSSASRLGLPATIIQLDRLDAVLKELAADLKRDSDGMSGRASKFGRTSQQAFASVGGGMIMANHAALDEATKARGMYALYGFEGEFLNLVADVLLDLRKHVVPPLSAALDGGLTSLRNGVALDPGKKLCETWSEGSVPAYLRPAPNEVLIDDVAAFPAIFDQQLCLQQDTTAAESAESSATEEIISGDYPRWAVATAAPGAVSNDPTVFVQVSRTWVPTRAEARTFDGLPQQAGYRLELAPDSLLRRADAWVSGRSGALKDFIDQQLADWLSERHADKNARAQLFAGKLATALRMSAPLAEIDEAVHMRVHGPIAPATMRLSPIPIDPAAERHQATLNVLASAGFGPAAATALTDPQSSANAVEISSFLGDNVHPVALGSLFSPVLRDWEQRGSVASRWEFWRFARARQLPQAMPIAPARQRAFVRGWYTACLLGFVDPLLQPWAEAPLSVWTRRGLQAFPRHLLGLPVTRQAEVLPALCESFPLAFAALSAGDVQHYEAYVRLFKLGVSPDGPEQPYTIPNAELARWIDDGRLLAPEPGFPEPRIPDEHLAGSELDDRVARSERILSSLAKVKKDTLALEIELTRETALSNRGAWEIRHLVKTSLDELDAAIASYAAAGPVAPGM